MKYFFIHKKSQLAVKTLYSTEFKGDLNFLITEQEIKETINSGKIKNYDKVPAFSVGEFVTMADSFSGEDDDMKKMRGKKVKVDFFNPIDGTIKFEEGVTNSEFYINDLKRI